MTRTLLTALALAASTTAAPAHEAPTGMVYSLACCHSTDCAPIDAASVKPVASGWLIVATGEVIEYGSHKIKDATDGGFHRCTYGGHFDPTAATRCLYVPPMGF